MHQRHYYREKASFDLLTSFRLSKKPEKLKNDCYQYKEQENETVNLIDVVRAL